MAKNNQDNILVIRLSAMGDVAMTIPVLLSFARTYPLVKITVLTKAFQKPFFADIPNVTVYVADVKDRHNGVFGLFRLFKELKSFGVTQIADLHNVLRSNILLFFFKIFGFSIAQIDKGRVEKKHIVNLKGGTIYPLKSSFQRYVDVFNTLGFPLVLENENVLPKKEMPVLSTVYDSDKQFIGIAPFAAFSGKCYPLEKMFEVVTLLNSTNKYTIFLFGGGDKETAILLDWDSKLDSCFSMAGKYSFIDELSVISNLDVMLAMDSGNAHLASMYGVSTCTLWGVTHPYAGFYPFGQDLDNCLLADRDKFPLIPTSIYGNKVPEGYDNVMNSIVPEQVFEKVVSLLNTTN